MLQRERNSLNNKQGCVRCLTLNCEFQREALRFDLRPVRHRAADVLPVVCRSRNHAVLAGQWHGVVIPRLRHCCCIAVGRGHPGDLGSRAAIQRLTARHDDWLSARYHRHCGGRILGLSWWMEGQRQEGEKQNAERRLKHVEIDEMEIRQLGEKIMCSIIDKKF